MKFLRIGLNYRIEKAYRLHRVAVMEPTKLQNK
jgi:hypothetical protein